MGPPVAGCFDRSGSISQSHVRLTPNSTMATRQESGHHAIAGFLYQLLGSGVEAFEIFNGPRSGDEPDEALLVERFGQDAAVLPSDGSNRKPRLIQYKHSSTGQKIVPSELREILQALLKSVRAQGMGVDQVEYKLVTNRQYSPHAEMWVAAKAKLDGTLEGLIRSSSEATIDDVSQLASIFRLLKLDLRIPTELREEVLKAGFAFGMLDAEIDARIDELVGLLMRKASDVGRRVVRREEIHRALTGCDNPFPLLSGPSAQMRRDDVGKYKREETDGQPTIPRVVSGDIARSVLEHPVTVVVGDGGSGKSVAVCDALTISLQELNTPPGFGLILPAFVAGSEAVMHAIAGWRNLANHSDGQALKRSVGRLRSAFPHNPLLVICIDAVDEKSGNARLPDEAQRFIRDLIQNALDEHNRFGMPVTSIILTCRRLEELENLPRGGFGFTAPHHRIDVVDFDDDEIELLAAELDGGVRDRIIGHFQMRAVQAGRMPSRVAQPVSEAVLEIIRHPVLWRFFSALDVLAQHDCLDGGTNGLDQLAARYRNWFRQKAEKRIVGLLNEECATALVTAALQFRDNPARIGERERDWLVPCVSDGCSRLHAIQIFEEAMTAGLLVEVERGGRRWRWRHTWLCEHLLRTGVNGR